MTLLVMVKKKRGGERTGLDEEEEEEDGFVSVSGVKKTFGLDHRDSFLQHEPFGD